MFKKITSLLFVVCLCSVGVVRAQLAGGTYTINSALPTAGTNYATFAAAIGAMSSGISGAVTFNVAAGSGPYAEQVTIGNITGASATNTIKFNGNGATVQTTATAAYQGVLMMNGAKFVKFDSLTFKILSPTYGTGIILYNACASDSITRCTVDMTALTSSSTTNYGIRVSTTASTTSTTASGATASYFGRNKILGATTSMYGVYYAVYSYGPNTGNIYDRNYVANFYYYGLYNYYGAGNKLLYNEITRETKTNPSSGGYGIYCYYPGPGTQVIGNRIHSFTGTGYAYTYSGFYGVAAYYATATAADPMLIANNAVYDMPFSYGFLASYCNNVNVYHNTIDYSGAAFAGLNTNYTYGGLYSYNSAAATANTTNFRNNLINVTGNTGTTYGGIYLTSGYPAKFERNVININTPSAASQNYAYDATSGTYYATLAAFQAAFPTQQAGAVSVNPQFTAPATGNLAPTNTAMFANGLNLQTVVPTDIVGQNRLVAPAPGCYEFQANGTNNAGMVSLLNPLGNYCPGSYPVTTTIYNAGSNSITSLTLNWSLNGVVQTPVSFTQTLAPLTSTTGTPIGTVTLGNALLAANTPVTLKVWTSNPNGSPDIINANDTLTATLQALTLDADAFKDTVCLNSGAVLHLTPASGFSAGALQWQKSTNGGGTWDPIPNSDVTGLASPNLTGNTWFRTKMTSGTSTCYSDTVKVFTTNPQLLNSTSDTMRCGPGPVTLQAQASVNAQVKWFDSPTSATPVATGNSYVTPYLVNNTSFWVRAGVPNAQPEPTNVVVTGTSTTSGSTYMPFYYFYTSTKNQYIVTAQEMMDQGYTAGYIKSVGLVTTSLGAPSIGNVNIGMKMTNLSTLTTFETGLQTVYTAAAYTLDANATNTFEFQNAFYWDGVSNIVISFCKGLGSGSGLNNFVCRYGTGNSVSYAYSSGADLCGTGTATIYTSNYRPNMLFNMTSACETPLQEIEVTVNPLPIVDLGADINKCVDEGSIVVLDAGVQPNGPQFLWDNNTTSQVRAVDASGDYSVKVTNQYTCVGSDTVTVILRDNPVVALGNDTTVCNGVVLNIDAGNDGIEYFWNTGSTAPSINVNSGGSYNVFVTNEAGCMKTDTILITMQGELPSIQGINISNNGQYTFHFTAVNPQNVIGYDWDFGDGKPHSYAASPYHTYADGGNYIVVLKLSSTCGFLSDTTSAHIVGIHQINVDNNELAVYPNPARDQATIHSRGSLKMEKIEVYNILGQVVYSKDADSKDKHTLQLSGLSSGLYTIQVFTDKGNVARKLEIIQ